uniref:GOLD domain-containing protein n=5 Tax=Chiroptera TaxID=9397 RepID=A0A671G7B2_RHIFE
PSPQGRATAGRPPLPVRPNPKSTGPAPACPRRQRVPPTRPLRRGTHSSRARRPIAGRGGKASRRVRTPCPVVLRPVGARRRSAHVRWVKVRVGRCLGLEDRRGWVGAGREWGRGRRHSVRALCARPYCVAWELGAGARVRARLRARDGRCLGRAATVDGETGVAAARAVRGGRPGALLPHRRDREALLHRGNPRRDHGHRSGGAGVARALRVPQTRTRRPAEQARCNGCVCSAGNYRTQMWDKQKEVFLPSTPGLGMHVEVKDPEGKVVLSRQYGSEGRFTFTSHTPGDHQICLHSNSTRMALFAGGRLRVHLDIQVGEHANNYPEIAAKDKLTELQLRARQLLDQVEQIQKEQDYQRYREERFRLTSESTNQRVLWWSIAQTVILILTGIWQMRHLKSFFEAKKLV